MVSVGIRNNGRLTLRSIWTVLIGIVATITLANGDHWLNILNVERENTTSAANIPAMLAALAEGGEEQMAAAQAAAEERGEAFVERRTKTSRLTGVTHVKFDQYYEGRRVFPGVLMRHEHPPTEADSCPTTRSKWLSGSYAAAVWADVGATDDVSDVDAAAKLQQLAAAAIAADEDAQRRENATVDDEHSEVIIYVEGEGTAARLAFYIYFVLKMGPAVYTHPFYIVDARTEQVLRNWEGLDMMVQLGEGPGGNTGGQYVYGGTSPNDEPKFWVDQIGGDCHMNVPKVRTYDMRPPVTPFNIYPCFYHSGDAINGGLSPLNDGQAMGMNALDFYLDWFAMTTMQPCLRRVCSFDEPDPIDMQLIMAMHWNRGVGASWTGGQIQIGDGDGVTWYPLASLAVVVHEVALLFRGGQRRQSVQLSHGFTEFNSGLIYWPFRMSSGMNEAFSDMMGVTAKFWYYGVADWMIGERVKVGGAPLRWLDDPPLDGRSIDHADDYFDGMDPHYSSGVYNKAFYLMSACYGMKTAMSLFYCANDSPYWTPDSTFDEGATGVGQCALDLGLCLKPAYCAFAAVGVTMGPLSSVCDPDPCVNGVCVWNVDCVTTCICCDGFSGPTCEDVADPSDPPPCENGGIYSPCCGTCDCPLGCTGDNCEQDIDECAEGLLVCGWHAHCVNTVCSAFCECDDGYVGDGFTCVACMRRLLPKRVGCTRSLVPKGDSCCFAGFCFDVGTMVANLDCTLACTCEEGGKWDKCKPMKKDSDPRKMACLGCRADGTNEDPCSEEGVGTVVFGDSSSCGMTECLLSANPKVCGNAGVPCSAADVDVKYLVGKVPMIKGKSGWINWCNAFDPPDAE